MKGYTYVWTVGGESLTVVCVWVWWGGGHRGGVGFRVSG